MIGSEPKRSLTEQPGRDKTVSGDENASDSCQIVTKKSWTEKLRNWPLSTLLIVGNVFCYRFSALGTVLPLYLLNVLKFSDNQTNVFFYIFWTLIGITPLIASIIADGYIGKYKTIVYSSLLIVIGKIVVALASGFISDAFIHPWVDFVGFLIIVAGSGGIGSCSAPFGGDQFDTPENRAMLSSYFSFSYAAMSLGIAASTIFLPMMRAHSCMGQDSCYPLSFGFSAGVMVFATVVVLSGSRYYVKNPPQGNVFCGVFLTIKLQKKRGDSKACEKRQFVNDVKSLLGVLIMLLPTPLFWTLYDQQYSVWVLQALQMNGNIFGGRLLILPDQMQFVNPLLVLVFVVIFDAIIYPFVGCFIKLTQLRKMSAGGLLLPLALVMSALLQIRINAGLPELPNQNSAFVSVINTFDSCTLNVSLLDARGSVVSSVSIPPNSSLIDDPAAVNPIQMFRVPALSAHSWTLSLNDTLERCNANGMPENVTYNVEGAKVYYMYAGSMGTFLAEADPTKPTGGVGEFSVAFVLALDNETYTEDLALCRLAENGQHAEECDPTRSQDFHIFMSRDKNLVQYNHTQNLKENSKNYASIYPFKDVRSGNWALYYPRLLKDSNERNTSDWTSAGWSGVDVEINDQGGVYVYIITGERNKPKKHIFQVMPSNSVSILWQLPQIAMLTAAEVLFSVTGYEFAYSQSPASLKSVVQALWFVSGAFGDGLLVGISLFNMQDVILQTMICAGAMFVNTIAFVLLAVFYYEYRCEI
ncbi:POT family domain-containing protein [Ditylenchus destructor]|uniref:POT family domain-containing protein n=1 Tax=Ditylenchus destructor TaxID=166010 RepID=A0AAD4NDX2_9BILA|nr:POT family domain-containing protein [Ditylenchus destructor]